MHAIRNEIAHPDSKSYYEAWIAIAIDTYSRVPNKRRPTGINFQFFSHGYDLIWDPTLIIIFYLGRWLRLLKMCANILLVST